MQSIVTMVRTSSSKKCPGNKGSSSNSKPKMTKAERKEKYTRLARERTAQNTLRRKGRTLTCLCCRQKGHVVEHCPDAPTCSKKNNNNTTRAKCCFKCGSTQHGLAACPRRNENGDDLPFATCFVCGKQGHLASKCQQNEKGIYVNGGCCKVCGSKLHLSKSCPGKPKEKKVHDDDDDIDNEDNFDDLLEGQGDDHVVVTTDKPKTIDSTKESSSSAETKPRKRRVVKF